DAVVNHLYEVARSARTYVGNARLAVDFSSHGFEQRLNGSIRYRITAGHHAWPVSRTVLAAGNTHAEKVNATFTQLFCPPGRVHKVRIASVDQEVSLIK